MDVELETGDGPLVVVGPNGAGKTTVLSLLLGALPAERGRVEVGDEVLLDTEGGIDVPLEDRRLGYVPQDLALFPHLSVRENLAFALGSAPVRLSRSDRAQRIDALLHELGLGHCAERKPGTLSGGEKQRVALARALSIEPRALLLDEPLSALDVHTRSEVRSFLAAYLRTVKLPTVIVTHDPVDAWALGHSVAVLDAGAIVQSGSWSEIVARPASPFVAAFVAPRVA
ncbi:MAG: ABC transporter ATP-binding protein [Myxococcaceae bacterium]